MGIDRRSWLKRSFLDLGKALAEAAEGFANSAAVRASGGQRHLRPPGAVAEAAFLLTCNRCGKCGEACPAGAIRFLPPGAGAAVGTPSIDPYAAACHLCLECTRACDTGALQPLTDGRQVRIGRAVLNQDACWAYRGQMCDVCYWQCPFPDEALRLADGKPVIAESACTGCGICAHVCPSAPRSIRIVPLGE